MLVADAMLVEFLKPVGITKLCRAEVSCTPFIRIECSVSTIAILIIVDLII